MKFSVRKGDLSKEPCDLLVLNAFEGFKTFGGATASVDKAMGGLLLTLAQEESFRAKAETSFMLYTHGMIPAKRILLVGLGKEKDFSEESVRSAAALSLQKARSIGAKKVVSVVHGAGHGGLHPKQTAKAIIEGMMLGVYEFLRHKSSKISKKNPDEIILLTHNGQITTQVLNGIKLGEIFANATIIARDLVNEPAQTLRPIDLVNRTKAMVKATEGKIQMRIYNKTQLEKMGAGGLLGIAQGSDHEPFLVHMIYKPSKAKKKYAFVGKAITFDSGGLSLKPAEFMENMKEDMAGAASVIGAMSALPLLAPSIEVHGIYGVCENMVSGRSIRPGDVVVAMNKKTIEVTNTDAEGRVTLADTLSYAVKQKPDMIIDLATLTGACMVALGDEIIGMFSNDDKVAQNILEAAKLAGESCWRLPLVPQYRKTLESKIADLNNVSGLKRKGGAITAALFLEEFVAQTPWAHLDIAGPAFAERPLNTYTPYGASGFGVRTLLELVRNAS